MINKNPKVLFLAGVDYANVGSLYSKSLNTVGIQSSVIIQEEHHLNFPDHGTVITNLKEIQKRIDDVDIIIFLHSIYTPGNYKGKRLFVFHGGSRYRKRPRRYNKLFNPIVEKSIVQTAEMLGLGAKNQVWLLPPVDTELLKPTYLMAHPRNIVIAHFPNRPIFKGSLIINKVMKQIRMNKKYEKKFIYKYSRSRVFWKQNIRRKEYKS
jgi:hypothetical protein